MRRRDLLLSGLILFNVSAFAQEPGVDEPIRYADDAKQIFIQDFECSVNWKAIKLSDDPKRPTTYYTWQSEPTDSITQITYYKRNYQGGETDNPSSGTNIYDDSKQWQIAGVRDTVMYMYDGVMRTDALWPEDSTLQWDSHSILQHDDNSQHGTAIGGKEYGLDRYGEDGGTQYFRYVSATSKGTAMRGGGSGSSWAPSHDETSTTQDHYVPEYRRNLFVRNIPIQDNSSYRVTVFIKPTLQTSLQKGVKARIGLDLMRGYFHSEKPFMVNDNRANNENLNFYTISYSSFSDKTDYTDLEDGKWNKVTLMAYYNNDSIGNASPYLLGYYWNDNWDWNVQVDEEGNVLTDGQVGNPATLKFIQQPAKYFVRMSFRSDSTVFDVDNISVTKSWIGGVEYYNDMLRVDFGYKTNMSELTDRAMEEYKIPAVQLPGDCVDVWALWRDYKTGETFWENVPILSAEYHGDGYMYMWSEPTEDGDLRNFDYADSVLVSFFNSAVPDSLKLKYTGDLYPNGLDADWIKAGKHVFDFHNEIASLNSTIGISPVTKQRVKSLAELCPVLQKEPYEDGTFGLDPKTRSFRMKFSKNLSFDNTGALTAKTKVTLKGNGVTEYWDIQSYPADDNSGWTTIVRPDEYTADLQGDYVLAFDQVTHLKNPDLNISDNYGDPVKLNYHFGDFNVAPKSSVVAFSNWRNDISDDLKEASNKRPIPTSVYIHTGTEKFQKGQGTENGNKCGFYNAPRDTMTICGTQIPDDGMFYLSNRTSGITGNLYSIVNLKKGIYYINFKLGGHYTTDIAMQLKFYAKPAADLEDGDNKGFSVLEGVANKTVLEAGKKPAVNQGGSYSTTTAWKDGIETLSYSFTVPADGDYVFEWVAEGSSNYNGYCISNYWITTGGDLSLAPVSKVNASIEAAADKLAAAAAAKYQGADFNALTTVKGEADTFVATKKATNVNLPSEYAAEVKLIDDAVKVLQLHMDTVDAFDKSFAAVEAKLAVYADSLKAYEGLAAVDALNGVRIAMSNYPYSSKKPGEIAADTKTMDDAVKAVDNRQTLNDAFTNTITDAKTSLANERATKFATEYLELDNAIGSAESFDAIAATDDELKAETASLNEAKFALDVKTMGAEIVSTRIKNLDWLAKTVGADYGVFATEIDQRVADIDSDDDALANVLKAAIKAALYDKIAKGDSTGVDLTPFIKNYHLYATPKYVERTDIKANSNEAKVADENGANIQHVQHQWNSGDLNGKQPIWIMILENDYETLYPGWTARATATGNCMVTPDDEKYSQLSQGVPIFDGQITIDWNGKAELKTIVESLPVGVYDLSVDLKRNTGSSTVLYATSGDVTYESKAAYNDLRVCAQNVIVNDGRMGVDFILTAGSGPSQADNFSLRFYALDSYDYAKAAEYAYYEFEYAYSLIDSTFVPTPYNPQVPDTIPNNRMYLEELECEAGSEVVIPIKMKNSDPIVGFSLDVELPYGISFVDAALTQSRKVNHSLSTNVTQSSWNGNSVVSMACLSLTNSSLKGYDGAVINLTVNVPQDKQGEFVIWLKNIEMTVNANEFYRPVSSSGILSVLPYVTPGDVNADGYISISDAVGVVNFIINADTNGLNRRAADINRDGVIDVADAVYVVNIVIRKNYAPMRSTASERIITSSLSMDDYSIDSNGLITIPITLNGFKDEITAFQFDLTLPDNLAVNRVATDESHLVAYGVQSDGTYKVVCLSLNSSTFTGNGDAAIMLNLTAGSGFDGGQVILDDAQLVTPNCSKTGQEPVSLMLSGSDVTGVGLILSSPDNKKYDVLGRETNDNQLYIQDGKKILDIKQ
jgi:hypothetical protein